MNQSPVILRLQKCRHSILRAFFLSVCIMTLGTMGFSQVEVPTIQTPDTDSLKSTAINALDSQRTAGQNKLKEGFNGAQDKVSNSKASFLNGVDSLKNKKIQVPGSDKKDELIAFRDSLVRSSLSGILNLKSSSGDVYNRDSVQSRIKSSVMATGKKVKDNTKLSGEIVSESFVTNYQDPFTVSEKVYSRLYGSPTLQVGSLPFSVDFFVTTEPNTIYNSNSFNVRFNTEQFKNNLRQKGTAKLQSLSEKKNELENKKNSLSQYQRKLGYQLEQEKKKVGSLESQLNGKVDLKAPEVNKPQIPKTPDLNGQKEQLTNSAENQLKQVRSTAKHRLDSLSDPKNHVNGEKLSSVDSAKYQEYLNRKAQLESLEQKYRLVDSIYRVVQTLDSVYGEKAQALKKQYSDPNILKQQAAKKIGSKKIAGVLSRIDYFEVGINYPFFSKLSLNGMPVKGLNTAFSTEKNHFKLVGGRTFNNQINTFGLGQPNPKFTRNVQGILFQHKTKYGAFEVSNASMWDSPNEVEPKRNFVQTVSWDQQLGKKLNIKINTAHSVYSDNFLLPPTSSEINYPSFLEQRLNQMAFATELRFRLDGQSKLKLEGQRIYPGFTNLSNPFMRNGYDEYKAQMDRKFFKRKLHTTVFYKHFADNITGIQQATNTMEGYGISARTNFRKAPNFFVQHAPYEQGNNHPDSIFRTNNQLSVTTAGVIYMKSIKKTKWSLISNFTRSHIDFNKGEAPVENRFYNAMITAQTSKMSFSANGYRNESKPYVDTLNYSGARIELGQQGNGKVLFSSSFFFDYYDSDDFRYNWVTTASFSVFKKLKAQTSFGLGMIDGLYGIERKDVYSGKVVLRYQL